MAGFRALVCMKILITGGGGFVGTALTKEFKKTADTIHLLSARIGDESAEAEIKSFHPDVVMHLAWEGIPDYGAERSAKNLVEQLAFYKALKGAKCPKIIVVGTCWEYGASSGKIREDATCMPTSPFSVTKHALRVIGGKYFDPDTIFIWTPLFYVYGVGQRPSSLVPHLIETAVSGNTPTLMTPGAANDFVHVDDVARALIALAKKNVPGGTYNIGSGKLTSVMDIVHMVCSAFTVPLPKGAQVIMREKPKGFYADISKIKRVTGWKPGVDIKSGVSEMLDDAKYQKNNTVDATSGT